MIERRGPQPLSQLHGLRRVTRLVKDSLVPQFAPVETLEKPILLLLEKMRDRLDRGEYSVIISDDNSGRIPAVLLMETINEIYRKSGREELLTVEPIDRRLHGLSPALRDLPQDQRVLIVTESIHTGNAIANIKELLNLRLFDIVSLYSKIDEAAYNQANSGSENRLYSAGKNTFFPRYDLIVKDHDWSGMIDPQTGEAGERIKLLARYIAQSYLNVSASTGNH